MFIKSDKYVCTNYNRWFESKKEFESRKQFSILSLILFLLIIYKYMFWALDFIFLLSRENGSESLYIGFFNKIMLSLHIDLDNLDKEKPKKNHKNTISKVSYMISFPCEFKVPSFMGWNLKDSSFCFWLLAIMQSQINLILRMEQVNKHVKRLVQYLTLVL